MGKIKEYKGIIILILVVLAGAFYWYEWRPSGIREQCFAEGEFKQAHLSRIAEERTSVIDDYYKACLHRFGLEK